MYFLDTFFNDLRTVMNTVVIKYEKKAKQNETMDSLRNADRYISARNMEDTFHTYQTFNPLAIINAGILDTQLAQLYATRKDLIPIEFREAIVLEQRKLIISAYEETNNYYRSLQGLPDNEDLDFVFLDPETYTLLGLDPDLAVHQLDEEAILRLEKRGYLDELRAKYPSKKYLNYLGTNKVDILRARTSRNFAILAMTKDVSETFYDEFNNMYEQCREYFMTVIHNKDFSARYDLYDNFIAMMIMVMTIQRMITNSFKNGIQRDFYDLGSIKMLMESYNVPFIADLPIDYQRALVRNMNSLLHYKSTDKVLYDICNILGFERIQIFKYFLIKEHRMDSNDSPIFATKTIIDDNGDTVTVPDNEAMYELYFQTVELRERNIALALADINNKLTYEQVVQNDPFWWDEDEELQKVLYDSEYNYVETKYLNMNIMYKMTEMLFEVAYIFRMLIDKKDELGTVTIQLPKLFDKREIPIFNVVVLMCALISKKNKMVGNIISSPTQILSVMGFNFYADFTLIKNEINNNPNLDKRMLSWILDLKIDDISEINSMFSNIRQLNDFIVERLGNTQNIEEYHAYKKLHDTLMVTQHQEALFQKQDGTIATTFLEYLEDDDPLLSTFVETVDENDIIEHIDHILYRINGAIKDLQYLYVVNDSNNVMLNAVMTLVRFFKSYTTDLSSFNILYLMNSRHYNMIKMIHDVELISKTLGFNENTLNMMYRFVGKKITTKITHKEELRDSLIQEFKSISSKMKYKDKTMAKPVLRDTIRLIREQ